MEFAVNQRLLGALLIIIGIISVPICDMDGTAAVVVIPMGIAALFGKSN